jgi:hypothetical protein
MGTLFLGDKYIYIRKPGPPGCGVLNETIKYGYGFWRDTDHLAITLHLSDSNLPKGSNIWSQVPEWARHQDIPTD